MAQRFEPVLRALNQAQVRFLVIGGVAVVLHGHLRATGDLDLVIESLARGEEGSEQGP